MGGKRKDKSKDEDKNKDKKKSEEKKTDMARLGLFKEDSYIFINSGYSPLDTFVWNESVHTGKQLKTQHFGKKDGTNRGYFNPFVRTFKGECLSDPLKLDRLQKKARKSDYYAGQFIYSSPGKKIHSSGHYSGTFSGPIPYFKPTVIKKKPRVIKKKPDPIKHKPAPKRKIFKLAKPKEGSGYGDVDCCINPYPAAMTGSEEKFKFQEDLRSRQFFLFSSFFKPPDYINRNPYYVKRVKIVKPSIKQIPVKTRFEMLMSLTTEPKLFKLPAKGKSLGGNKDGCFSKFPYYSMQRSTQRSTRKQKVTRFKPIITTGSKSSTFKSVVETNVNKRVNNLTYKELESVLYVKQKKPFDKNDKTCI